MLVEQAVYVRAREPEAFFLPTYMSKNSRMYELNGSLTWILSALGNPT